MERDDCIRATRQVCTRLLAAVGWATERISEHLDEQSGWLSIDVINVLCAANFDIEVEAAPFPAGALAQESEAAFLINCNQRHWTVLRQQGAGGPWEHINSIGDDGCLWHWRKDVGSKDGLQTLFEGLQDVYGGFSLHRIKRGVHCSGGVQFLEKESRRASVPQEVEMAPDAQGRGDVEIHNRVSILSLNVDGLGEYRQPACCPQDRCNSGAYPDGRTECATLAGSDF